MTVGLAALNLARGVIQIIISVNDNCSDNGIHFNLNHYMIRRSQKPHRLDDDEFSLCLTNT